MIYIKYGTTNFATQVWGEIEKGNPVALQIYGWRKRIIHQLMSLYAEYSQGHGSRSLFFKIGWRSVFAPSIMGLCNHARSFGMTVNVSEESNALIVKFEKTK